MRKLNLLFPVFIFFLAACAITGGGHKIQKKYIPAELKKVYLGMSMADFKKARPNVVFEEDNIMNFRVVGAETFENGDITLINYYFDAEGEFPLYEIIISYKDAETRNAVVEKLYGEPNFEKEWRFDSEEDFEIMVWNFAKKIVIAGRIAGTEWDNKK